jgi:quinol-cytochrome oxidoreductase complex cytochrome b subunit
MKIIKTFCDASVDWQFGFQEPATPTAEGILDFHDYLVFFCILICILVFFCILILVFLPLINFSKIRSSKFRPIFSFFYWFLFVDFLILGWIGQKPVESPFIEVGMFATAFYFIFFILLLPSIGLLEYKLLKYKI